MAIAEWIRDGLHDAGLELRERPGGLPGVRMPSIGESIPRPYSRPELIAEDAGYGEIVCFCERVSRAEIRDAAAGDIPPLDLDGLRRRTRVLMGRCQGFYCAERIARELSAGIGVPARELRGTA